MTHAIHVMCIPPPSLSVSVSLRTLDSSLLSNIQKLFFERIEVFGTVQFDKPSIITGIIKIFLKVSSIIPH